ncbi:hypothetical protein KSP40_PGU004800 [Platanthera guangdongensis]|uniref:Uncharacterized protein n=1 Tax=Platanthera guangdongensis TaxID=2320717 RepID=A0ABR2MY43_9ASPA
MEIVIPVQEFRFDSSTKTPFMSAPSSPKRFDFYCRDATGPTSLTVAASASRFSPPHKSSDNTAADDDKDDDFAFEFSGPLNKGVPLPEITTADELFEKGKIRTLKFPLKLCPPAVSHQTSGEFSHPFSADANAAREGRLRSRGPSISASRSRKGSRSLSPLRDAGESDRFQDPNLNGSISCSCKDDDGDGSSGGGGRKWCFKNLLLFRSASEGRATGNSGKDRLRKYTAACSLPRVRKMTGGDEWRGSSFRYGEIGSSARRDNRKGLSPSPHAVHYEASRAAAEEMRKKTALPYKEGFFSFLRFAPASWAK